MVEVSAGTEGRVQRVVTDADTARVAGSGDVDVLATPAVVALCEAAAVAAVADSLEPGTTTVGARISLDHLAPTAVGRTVTATARLERVQDRTLEFLVEASDGAGTIATGLHVRVVVRRDAFLAAAQQRG
ncbi:MAG TPA: hotdog domain-containing protein [Actinomycetota bacterium]|nr:hotdog domain-containing protein [Actinomycetota bacterium]